MMGCGIDNIPINDGGGMPLKKCCDWIFCWDGTGRYDGRKPAITHSRRDPYGAKQ